MYDITNYYETQLIKIKIEWLTFTKSDSPFWDWSRKMALIINEISCNLAKDTNYRSAVLQLLGKLPL